MANQQNRLSWIMDWKVDQQSFNQIITQLKQIQNLTRGEFADLLHKPYGDTDLPKQMQQIQRSAKELEQVMYRTFNQKLGTSNLTQLKAEIDKLGGSKGLQRISSNLSQLGPIGTKAFNDFSTKIFTTNVQLKESNKLIKDLSISMMNTVKWGVTSSIFNNMTNAISQAWNYTKKLDSSLNDIRIVTGKSADEMAKFAIQANKAAASLGKTTTDYTEASLIYYQQGLSEEAVQARTQATLKAANVTGQSSSAVSEQLTAVWNGFELGKDAIAETELFVDKLAAVAAETAADLEELSVGMGKVASAANLMGVDIDELSAQLATIVSVTRQAPESVGTALKTIYARMGDIEAGLDAETTLGEYTAKMAEFGVDVLDSNGKLRDMGDIIAEIGEKWDTMSREQQVALSQVMAGTRQYNNLLSLFNNWDMYTQALNTSKTAAGTLQKQQDIYMQSTEAHLEKLTAAWERIYNSLSDRDIINGAIDTLTKAINNIGHFTEAIGGMGQALNIALASLTMLQSKNLGDMFATRTLNKQKHDENEEMQKAKMAIAEQYLGRTGKIASEDYTNALAKMTLEVGKYTQTMSEAEQHEANNYMLRKARILEEKEHLALRLKAAEDYTTKVAIFNNDIKQMVAEEANRAPSAKLYPNLNLEHIEDNALNKDKADFQNQKQQTTIDQIVSVREEFRDIWNAITDSWVSGLQDFKQKTEQQVSELTRLESKIENIDIELDKNQQDFEVAKLSFIQAGKGSEEDFLKTEQALAFENKDIALVKYKAAIEKELAYFQANAEEERQKIAQELQQTYNTFRNSLVELRGVILDNQLVDEDSMVDLQKNYNPLNLDTKDFPNKILNNGLIDSNVISEMEDNVQEYLNVYEDVVDTIAGELNNTKKEIKNGLVDSVSLATNAVDNLDQEWNQFLRHFDLSAQISSVINLAGSIGQVGNAAHTLWNLPKIFSNDTLSGSEKFLQVIMNLSSAVTLFGIGIKSAVDSWKAITAGAAVTKLKTLINLVPLYSAGMTKLNAGMAKQALISARLAQLWKAQEIALSKLNEEEKENLRLKLLQQATDEANLFFGNKEFVNSINQTVAANGKQTKSWLTVGKAMLNAKGITGALIAKIALVAAAVAAAVVVIYAIVKAVNAQADAEKNLIELTKRHQEAYTELKNSYDQLKRSLEDYDEARKAIANMTQGTQEWLEKTQELRDQIIELIKLYPELAPYVTFADGVPIIDEKGREEFVKKENEKVKNAAFRTIANQKRTIESEHRATTEKNTKEFYPSDLTIGGFKGPDGAQYVIDREFLLNALTALYIENGKTLETEGDMKQLLLTFAKHLEAQGIDTSDFQSNIDNLADTLFQNRLALIEQADALEKNQKAMGTLTRAIIEEAIDEDTASSEYKKSDYKDNIKDSLVTDYDVEYQKALEKWNKTWDNDVHKEYLKANSDIYEKQTGKLQWGQTTFKKKGSDETEDVEDINMRQFLAERDAKKAMQDAELNNSKAINKMGEELEKLGLDKEQARAIMRREGEINLNGLSPEQVEQLKALNFTGNNAGIKQGAEKLGYGLLGIGASTEFQKSIDLAVASYDPTVYWREQVNQAKNYNDLIKKLAKDGITEFSDEEIKQLEQIENKYSELKALKDERGSYQYFKAFNKAVELEEDQKTENLANIAEEELKKLEAAKKELEDLQRRKNNAASYGLIGATMRLDVDIKAKTDEINEILDELEKTEIEIKAAIKADLESDWKSGFNLAEQFGHLTDLATEDLLLSFDEAQELIDKGYGEVLINAEAATGQQIKLSKAQLEAYVADRRAEMEMDRKQKISDLQAEADILKVKRAALVAKKELLQKGINAETVEAKAHLLAQAQMAQAEVDAHDKALEEEVLHDDKANEQKYKNAEKLATLLGTVEDAKTKTEQDGQADAAEAAYQSACAQIDYANQIGTAAANVSTTIGNIWTGRATYTPSKATKYGGTPVNTTPTVNTTPANNGYVPNDEWTLDDWKKNIIEEVQKEGATTQEQIDTLNAELLKQLETVDDELDLTDTQLGSIYGAIAALKSAGKSLDDALAGAGKGSGGKGSKDELKDKLDIYHDINIEIQQVNNKLEELQEWEEEVFGTDLIYNLRNQIQEMNKQIENYSQKLKIAEGEAETLNAKLEQTYGARFNDDGTLMNYEEMFNRELQMVQGIYKHYDGLSDDEKKKYEQTKEDAEKRWEDFKETFERYDTLITEEMPEILQSQREEENKKIEAQMKKFNLEIEVRLDLTEAENNWLDFKKALLEDDDFLEKTQLDVNRLPSYYNEDNTGIVQTGTQHVADILTELQDIDENGSSQVYGTDKVKALKDLQTYYQQLMKDLEQVEKIVDDVKKSYIDMMKESQDAFKTQIETYKQISDLYNHDMKVIELIYGEKSYSELAKYYELLEENNNKQLDFQKQQVDLWKRQMDSIDPEKNKEAWETARDNWKSAVTDLNALIESSIATLQEKYTNAIDKIFNDLNNKITEGKGLDYISEEWDLLEQNSEQFLDEINSLYGIEDIARKYQEAIDNTDNLNVQKKLKDVMEQELKSLREKDKLTEYDIERAEKKYDLTLKQIALEEAQQNKSQLRLRRDSQGNYTYQYVADADEIAKAEQELADARNELYNFDLEQYKEKLGEMYDAYEEFQEKMKEAAQINDPEERAAKELLIREQYEELINGLVMQNEDIRNNLYESAFMELSALRGKELEEYTNLTQAEKDLLMNDLIPQWDSGIQHMADVFAAEGGFIPTCEEALDELKEATNNYQTDLDELEQAAGIDFSKIKDGIDKTADATKILLEDNGLLITSYETELIAIGNLVTEMDNLIERYQTAYDEAKKATQAAYDYWRAANMDTANAAKNDKYNPIGDGKDSLVEDSNNSDGNSLNSSSSDSGDAAFGDGKTKDGQISQDEHMYYDGSSGEKWYHDSYGDTPTGGPSTNDFPVQVTQVVTNPKNGQDYLYHIEETSGRQRTLGWVKKKALKGYDTGGYTGSWGDEGRLALLHQKELVLNAQDTANMLNAVDILRDITNTIGTTMLNRLAQVSGNANGILAGLGMDTLEQNVHIDATFPNVQSSNEIENAFKNLTNIAAQRIYRS